MNSPFQLITATDVRAVCGTPEDAKFLKDLVANDCILRGRMVPGATVNNVAMYDGNNRPRMVQALRDAGWTVTNETNHGCIKVSF